MSIDFPPRELAESLNRVAIEVAPEWQENVMQEVELEVTCGKRYTAHTYEEDKREVENLLQPYLGDFAPKGTVKIGSVANKLEIAQIDMRVKATEMAKFFSTRYPKWSQSGKDPLSTDFVGSFLQEMVVSQIARELNQMSVKGVRQTRLEGVTAPFLTTFDGFSKVFSDQIALGNMQTITTGVITAANILEKVNFALDQVSVDWSFYPGKIRMSRTMARWFSRAYKAAHPYANAVTADPTGKFLMVDDYNLMIEPVLAMEGLNEFWIDFEVNGQPNMITVYHDEIPALPVLRFEADKRDVCIMGELHRCYGLRRYEYTYKTKVA